MCRARDGIERKDPSTSATRALIAARTEDNVRGARSPYGNVDDVWCTRDADVAAASVRIGPQIDGPLVMAGCLGRIPEARPTAPEHDAVVDHGLHGNETAAAHRPARAKRQC